MTTPAASTTAPTNRTYTIEALTDIWTGDADRKGDRLITTGLLGSIRWWFEVLVRGLGGSACDPSDPGNRCPQDSRKQPTDEGHHCVVCELFGCTGWARKFRFQVLDTNGNVKSSQIKKGETVKFVFTELRPIREEEWALLDLTLRLIADYGAIGGRMVFKPSDEQNRQQALHHKDFGLIKIVNPDRPKYNKDQLREYVKHSRWRQVDHGNFAWASLENFWCVKGRYLARQDASTSTFNQVIGRKQQKNLGQQLKNKAEDEDVDRWLAGRQQESKKVFSFKDPPRTFGFVKPGLIDFNAMRGRLNGVWQNVQFNFEDGPAILRFLLT
ncbi:MAG: type III-B CRISPR module RAMP protein Cmr1 [Candidatus Oleimicrobiaceae bacterium]